MSETPKFLLTYDVELAALGVVTRALECSSIKDAVSHMEAKPDLSAIRNARLYPLSGPALMMMTSIEFAGLDGSTSCAPSGTSDDRKAREWLVDAIAKLPEGRKLLAEHDAWRRKKGVR